jgi:nucleoside-diphosphate-sugar epimerase
MKKNMRIFIAGHGGMVGSAIQRRLQKEGFEHIVTRPHAALDLTDQHAVKQFFNENPVDYVVLAAARVGGIHANDTFPADFIYQNLMIQTNVIHAACAAGVRHLLFLGSSCIYPKNATQPLREEALLGGWLEPTNEPYAIAKIAGIKLCESYNRQYATHFRSVMPTNLYGPNDNYDLETSQMPSGEIGGTPGLACYRKRRTPLRENPR